MEALIAVIGVVAAIGSGVVGGVFFAFSSFVMKALASRPDEEGMAAMQSINVVVINPSFLGAFIGTGVLSLGLGAVAVADWARPFAPLLLGGAISYFVGTFMVTVRGNVPLNDKLAATDVAATGAGAVWREYSDRWTRWNHVRALCAVVAALLYTLGLMRMGGE